MAEKASTAAEPEVDARADFPIGKLIVTGADSAAVQARTGKRLNIQVPPRLP